MRSQPLLFSALICLLFSACSENLLDVDVSKIEVEVESQRLDQKLFNADFSQPGPSNQSLSQEFGSFYKIYLEEILKVGPVDRAESLTIASEFCTDYYMKEAYDAIQEVHNPKMNEYQESLTEAFKHFKYYFPDAVIPKIIYYHSGFNYGVFSTDSCVAVGLEWFLGKDHSITKSLPFPRYRQEKMQSQFMVANIMKDWSNKALYAEIAGENLLETIVYYGKIMYLVDASMPNTPDSIKMNYSSQQMQWCHENEFNVWKELASDQNTLYETKPFEINKWVSDAPFTSGLPAESPGMVGIWIGWMMLRDHHQRFPKQSINEVLNTEASDILRSYNPKR